MQLFKVNFSASVDAFADGSINPGDSAFFVAILDVFPKTEVVFIKGMDTVEHAKTLPHGGNRCPKGMKYQRNQGVP